LKTSLENRALLVSTGAESTSLETEEVSGSSCPAPLIDERTQGRLRELVEEAGGDLAALVAETLDDTRDA